MDETKNGNDLNILTQNIKTQRLIIKPITLKYKKVIFTEFTNEITTHMYPKPAKRIEETIEFIETSMRENEEGTNFQTVILSKETREFLGCGGAHNIHTKTPELGIWIKKSAHSHGYGKEAVTALKKWADEHLDYEYLLYPVVKENHASRRIPEALGGKIEREYDEINMQGKSLHLLEYRIYPIKNKSLKS
ncbi:N-acetyltransferase [Candidatus Peregrinibacteria bacterium CG_4_10_14_0_2_um_filter_43_11]|nr:MAG: N-acetyltransferase [Candidatus Peregrinibacteria bacterium CG_4_10_14_0_2_um_filter_43_11]